MCAESRNHAIGEDVRSMIQEELLDHVRLVAEAQDEVRMAVLAVVLHHVPEDRLVADRDHRLRDVLGIFSDPGAEATAEKDNFHQQTSLGSMTLGSGIGT